MAWVRNPDGAVELINSSGVSAWLGTSSKCTVNLYPSASTADALRMFGITRGDGMRNSLGDVTNFSLSAPPDPTTWAGDAGSEARDSLLFLDAVDDPTEGRLRFIIEAGAVGPKALQATVIPTRKNNVTWLYTKVLYGAEADDICACEYTPGSVEPYGGDNYTVTNVRDQEAEFTVDYSNPCVIPLPGEGDEDGWLMVLSRVRSEASGGVGTTETTLSDIVGYVARRSDPGFQDATTIKGPYWLACSIGTLGPGSDGIRFWLSVPGAAMISSQTLAVYFVIEVAGINCWSVCGNEDAKRQAQRAIGAFDRQSAVTADAGFRSCVGVHLIELADLLAMPFGQEGLWALDSTATSYVNYLVPREKAKLFLWQDDGSGGYSELVDATDYLKVADPQLARCTFDPPAADNYGKLRMFVAGINRAPDPDPAYALDWLDGSDAEMALFGLWMAVPMADDVAGLARPDGSLSTSERGVDFVLTESSPFEAATFGGPATIDSEEVTDYSLPLDPDPVRLIDGSWRVYFGLQEEFSDDDTGEPMHDTWYMGETDNSDGDVCAGAAMAPAIVARAAPHVVDFHRGAAWRLSPRVRGLGR